MSKPSSEDQPKLTSTVEPMDSCSSIVPNSNHDTVEECNESNKRTKTDKMAESLSISKGDDVVEDAPAVEELTTQPPIDDVQDCLEQVIEFNVVYMKKSHKISMKSTETVGHLKTYLGMSQLSSN